MTPADDLTVHVEAATLGALLLGPPALTQTAWLQSRDFSDPWHARVHHLLRQHPPADVCPQRLGAWLSAEYPPHVADMPRVAALLEAAPLRPDPVAYARLVVASSIRRDQSAYGVLLRGGALQAALTRSAHPMRAAAEFADRALIATHNRWNQAYLPPGTPTRPRPPSPGGTAVRDVLLGADRYLAAHGEPDPDEVRAREQALVAALITHPHGIAPVMAWLDPDTLTDGAWRATYHAIGDLAAAGERIDEVTVLWRTSQLIQTNGTGPQPRCPLAAVEDAAAYDPAWCAQAVAGDQLRALAQRASDALRANAANPGLTIPDLLDSARAYTGAVADLAQSAFPQHSGADSVEQVLPLVPRRPPDLAVLRGAG